jgi:hypothetical protein
VKVLVSLRRKINASIKLHHCCFWNRKGFVTFPVSKGRRKAN